MKKRAPGTRSSRRHIGAVEGTSHVAVLHNAVRLLEDARILRKARRYPSSAALAILSLEELAKFLALNEDFTDWISPKHRLRGRRRYDHRQKQKLSAQALIWGLGFDEVRDLLGAQGYTIEFVPIGTKSSDNPSIVDIISSIDDRTFEAKVAKKIGGVDIIDLLLPWLPVDLTRSSSSHFMLIKMMMAH